MAAQQKTQVPGWAKGTIAIALLGGIGFIAWNIYSKLQEAKKLAASKKEEEEVKTELKEVEKKITASYSPSQYQIFANALFQAMDGYGTDWEYILKMMAAIKNDTDFLKVNAAFGIREISSGSYNPEPNFKGTLSQALYNELNSDDINVINEMLAKKGIKYRF